MSSESPFQTIAEIEARLTSGKVIHLAMPSDAVALLLRDEQGKFCFIWDTCYYGEDKKESRLSFETAEQLVVWVFSRLYSHCVTRQEAGLLYGEGAI